jgi:hypothetical protein
MVEFWTNETKVSRNKKYMVRHRISRKRWEEHAIHFLEEPHVHSSIYFIWFYASAFILVLL